MSEDLLIHSMSNFRELILSALEVAGARRIVEIGAEYGSFTQDLCAYAHRMQGQLITVDPEPKAAAVEFADNMRAKTHFRFIKATSLEVLPQLENVDAYIVDGDHNYYTVKRELELISQMLGERPFLVFEHDVGWPLGRRDAYYAPDRIPQEYLHPHTLEGVTLDNRGTIPSGFRMCPVAKHEGGPRNGVLTAIDDFLADHPDLHLDIVPAVFGLGVIYSMSSPWSQKISRLLSPFSKNPLLERLERNRLRLYLRVLEDDYRAANPGSTERRPSDCCNQIETNAIASMTPDELLLEARRLSKQGDWEKAACYYQELTKISPDNLQGWLGRWECSASQGHGVLADLVLEEAVEHHPDWITRIQAFVSSFNRPM